MIYAKEPEELAKNLLGEDIYKPMSESKLPGGKGHEIYEKWRKLPANDPQRSVLEQKSKTYYNNARKLEYVS